MYYRSRLFPFLSDIENQWQLIRDELDQYLAKQTEQAYTPYPITIPYSNEWKLLGIYQSQSNSSGIPNLDEQMARNLAFFPKTGALVKAIPGIIHAGFSKITPGTHIRPHKENYGNKLRCHLGIKVPDESDCAFMVAGKTKHWHEGDCLVFDGNSFHEAWNYTNTSRIVLLIDLDRDAAIEASSQYGNVNQQFIEPYSSRDRLNGYLMRIRSRYHRSKMRRARKKNEL